MEVLGGLPGDCSVQDIEHALHVRHAMHRVEATGEDCVFKCEHCLGHHPEMLEGRAASSAASTRTANR